MRFALRKQDKIKEVLGNEYLENNILQSLNKYFENSDNDRIYSDIEPDGYVTNYGNKYPLLRINDVANSDAMLEFAVMGQMYDVLNLSYVGRMKGIPSNITTIWYKLEGQNTIVCNVRIYWRILPKTFEILPL